MCVREIERANEEETELYSQQVNHKEGISDFITYRRRRASSHRKNRQNQPPSRPILSNDRLHLPVQY